MKKYKSLLLILAFTTNSTYADSIFKPQESTHNRYTPSTTDIDESTEFHKKYNSEIEKRVELQKKLDEITKQSIENKNQLTSDNMAQNNQISTSLANMPSSDNKDDDILVSKSASPKSNISDAVNRRVKKPDNFNNTFIYQRPLVFGISLKTQDKLEKRTIVPAGSYVKAKILTGVEASTNADVPYPMLMQADFAFTGPNKTKIDMSGCLFIAKTTGDLSTERVLGQLDKISCVKSNGKYEERNAFGYLAGEDSTFGVIGQLISRQGQVLGAAIIASLAKGIGDSISLAQSSNTVVAGATGAPATASNVTGDHAAYVAGKSIVEPASIVANWYLKYAEKLVPAIAVGSGRYIWVVLQKPVEIPALEEE